MRRAVATALAALTLAVAGLVGAPAPPADAAGTLAWPHFLKIHVENRRVDTRIIVEVGTAGTRWVSQPGVVTGDYLIRVDQSGFVRSLDDKLALWRQGSAASRDVVVRVQAPGVDGTDVFAFDAARLPMSPRTASLAAGPGNAVFDVQPYVPTFKLPMEFEIQVGGRCRPNQYLQVAPEWTNTVWRTPDGIGPGTYRVRMNADQTVQSLDGKTTFTQIPAQPWDHGHQILGVLIVHSCDPAGDGADIVGFGRNADGSLQHMTTWDQRPDGGYGWQPFNCGQGGVCSSSPRESFHGGNHIVQVRPQPATAPLRFAPTRLSDRAQPAVSVRASEAQFARQSATDAVLARFDNFADALAGIPLALRRNGPLLLSSRIGVEAEVVEELRRVVRPGGTVWLLGGTAALNEEVEATIRRWGFVPRRVAGPDRIATAVEIAKVIGPAAHAFVVNGWNFPDALSAGAAAGAVAGGAHILLTDPHAVPATTAVQLAGGGYDRRTVFGGDVVVHPRTFTLAGAHERVAGADRDATAAAAARRFATNRATVWVADGRDFVGGISAGAMAAFNDGPLLLVTGALGDASRSYLKATAPGAGFVVGSIDEGVVSTVFALPSRLP